MRTIQVKFLNDFKFDFFDFHLTLGVIGCNYCRGFFIGEVNVFLEFNRHSCGALGTTRTAIATCAEAAFSWAACSKFLSSFSRSLFFELNWLFLDNQKLSVFSISTCSFESCFKLPSDDSNWMIAMRVFLENNGSWGLIIHFKLEGEGVITFGQCSSQVAALHVKVTKDVMLDHSMPFLLSITVLSSIPVRDVFITVDFEVESGGIHSASGVNSNMDGTGNGISGVVIRLCGLYVNITAIHTGS